MQLMGLIAKYNIGGGAARVTRLSRKPKQMHQRLSKLPPHVVKHLVQASVQLQTAECHEVQQQVIRRNGRRRRREIAAIRIQGAERQRAARMHEMRRLCQAPLPNETAPANQISKYHGAGARCQVKEILHSVFAHVSSISDTGHETRRDIAEDISHWLCTMGDVGHVSSISDTGDETRRDIAEDISHWLCTKSDVGSGGDSIFIDTCSFPESRRESGEAADFVHWLCKASDIVSCAGTADTDVISGASSLNCAAIESRVAGDVVDWLCGASDQLSFDDALTVEYSSASCKMEAGELSSLACDLSCGGDALSNIDFDISRSSPARSIAANDIIESVLKSTYAGVQCEQTVEDESAIALAPLLPESPPSLHQSGDDVGSKGADEEVVDLASPITLFVSSDQNIQTGIPSSHVPDISLQRTYINVCMSHSVKPNSKVLFSLTAPCVEHSPEPRYSVPHENEGSAVSDGLGTAATAPRVAPGSILMTPSSCCSLSGSFLKDGFFCDRGWTCYDFSGAHLGDRGVVPVLLALAQDPRLGRVRLSNCALRGASAAVLADFVRDTPMLKSVDLSGNCLSLEAGTLLAGALEERQRHASPVEVNLTDTALAPRQTSGEPSSGVFLCRRPSAASAGHTLEVLRTRLLASGAYFVVSGA